MDSSSTNDPSGSRFLGRYELVQLLGQGGMGEVYLAKISGAAGFEKPCIVKTILPALLKDRQFLDRFHHEAKVLVHLVHSSIAQVYDMGEAENTYYMALEYVAGVDLAFLQEQARAQQQLLPLPVALYLGQHICEGLGYAHRKLGPDGQPLGIVHRDVSPHNVMLSYEGEVKVIDFGLAKSAARSKYTLPSTVMGKLGYMSPEQVRGEAVDHRSDIYSCGVVVWELIAGQSLFAQGTVGEMMAAMSNPVVPALHELRPDVDPALDAVVRRALAPSPAERYTRTDDFARALSEQLLRLGGSLGAEEVGAFVRALCPEAFASQRQLLSRLSSSPGLRRTPPPAPLGPTGQPLNTLIQAPGPDDGSGIGFASTMVRADSRTAVPVVAVPVSAETVIPQGPGRKGWTAAILLGALGLVGASAGVTAVMMNRRPPPPAAWAQAQRPPPPQGMFGDPGAHAPPPGGPERPPPPPQEPPPPNGMPPPPPPPMVGAPEEEPRAVADNVPARASRLVAAEHVMALRPGRDNKSFVLDGQTEGLRPGSVVQVVAGPVRDGKAKLLGEAKVTQVSERRTVVFADARVRRADHAERLVVLPAAAAVPVKYTVPAEPPPVAVSEPVVTPKAPPKPAEAGTPAARRELMGRIADRSVTPLRKTFEVTNTDTIVWSHCILVAQGRKMLKLGGMAPGTSREVSLGNFEPGVAGGPFVKGNYVGLFCDEGKAEFYFKH
ncbi:protein kinase domain-containing protein [Melittangium boletus]|uniref:serine/threonine protein kinase n=1 Tax=Melittangium boletus TaxID=83453 RepID=UPI003DA4F633